MQRQQRRRPIMISGTALLIRHWHSYYIAPTPSQISNMYVRHTAGGCISFNHAEANAKTKKSHAFVDVHIMQAA